MGVPRRNFGLIRKGGVDLSLRASCDQIGVLTPIPTLPPLRGKGFWNAPNSKTLDPHCEALSLPKQYVAVQHYPHGRAAGF
jgi:hypothetical protein